jgi:hypothetical protein
LLLFQDPELTWRFRRYKFLNIPILADLQALVYTPNERHLYNEFWKWPTEDASASTTNQDNDSRSRTSRVNWDDGRKDHFPSYKFTPMALSLFNAGPTFSNASTFEDEFRCDPWSLLSSLAAVYVMGLLWLGLPDRLSRSGRYRTLLILLSYDLWLLSARIIEESDVPKGNVQGLPLVRWKDRFSNFHLPSLCGPALYSVENR